MDASCARLVYELSLTIEGGDLHFEDAIVLLGSTSQNQTL